MSDAERAIGRLEGKMDAVADRVQSIDTKVDQLTSRIGGHDLKWARLGAYAIMAGVIGSALFQIGLALAK